MRTIRVYAARVAACVAIALAAPAATAGVRLELSSEPRAGGSGTAAAPEHFVVWIDGGRLAAEPAKPGGSLAGRRVVFRAHEDVAWLIDTSARSYFQLDPKSAQETAAQVVGLRDGVARGIDGLAPEQRERMQALLGELAAPAPAARPALRVQPTGKRATQAGIGCAQQEVFEGERRVAVACVADGASGPLARERVAAVPALGSFARRTLGPLAQAFPSLAALAPLAALERLGGLPLTVVSAEPDAGARQTKVLRVAEAAVDPALFELPPGFTRSTLPPFE
jgi:hypothetical protein